MAPKKDMKKKAAEEEPKAEEPPAKKAKGEEEKAEPEEPKEKEQDAAADKRPGLTKQVGFDPTGYSLNVVPTMGGKMLMSLSDGGMQYLVGGARANVGLKAGRYMFEVKVFELLSPDEGKSKHRTQQPKQFLRVGFSTADSPLLLGDADGCVAFDADGTFWAGTTKTTKPLGKFGRDMVVAVLINLDPKSPNANTVSLFRSGVRVSEPMPLPDDLKGKALFPHISFRNVSVQVNFGKAPMAALPFTCRMVQDAAKPDTVEAAAPTGKATVVFPVSLPDQGTFDWLDGWLEGNPSFTELSDRKVNEWAVKSGVWKSKGWSGSNDKPYFNTGLALLDDASASRVIQSIAPCVPRDYVLMEVKQNLCAEDRAANLKKFSSDKFTKVARVIVGKPPKAFVEKVHKTMLEQKQAKLEGEWNRRKAEKARKKLAEKKQKELAEKKKKNEEAMKKKAEEAATVAKEAKRQKVLQELEERKAQAEKSAAQAEEAAAKLEALAAAAREEAAKAEEAAKRAVSATQTQEAAAKLAREEALKAREAAQRALALQAP
mmetsp:Transcript_80420/g.209785  ORF Transcript_80420/g.209785 Transcript_80420/m.209785 type:complete len:545 (+) Transcript_80420:90-1724(+)